MLSVTRISRGAIQDKNVDKEFDSLVQQLQNKGDALYKDDGLTSTITIDPTKTSVVTIKNGQITSWTQK